MSGKRFGTHKRKIIAAATNHLKKKTKRMTPSELAEFERELVSEIKRKVEEK